MDLIYREDVLEIIEDNIEVPINTYDLGQMDALEWLKYEVQNIPKVDISDRKEFMRYNYE